MSSESNITIIQNAAETQAFERVEVDALPRRITDSLESR